MRLIAALEPVQLRSPADTWLCLFSHYSYLSAPQRAVSPGPVKVFPGQQLPRSQKQQEET